MKTRVFTSSLLSLMFVVLAYSARAQQWTTAGTDIYNSNTGNVGINNTNPLVKLAVDISSTTTTYNGYTGANVALMLKNKSNTANNFTVLSFANSGTNTIADITAINTNHSTHTGRLSFSTRAAGAGPQQRMLIDENGNVGIGTATPGGKLEINTGTGSFDGLRLYKATDNDKNWISFWQGSGASGVFRLGQLQWSDGMALHVGGSNASSPGALIQKWNVNGNVGIGTATPQSILHVAKNDHINLILDRPDTQDFLTLYNGSSGSGIRLSNSNFFSIMSDPYASANSFGLGTEFFRINPDGNIGIGTTTPSNMQGWHRVLDVSGTNHAKILATALNSTYKVGVFAHDPSWYGGGGFIGTESNHNLFFITGYNAKMMIGTNGNVGIGTENPDAKLAVKGTIHAQEVRVDLNGAVAPDYVFEKDYNLMPLEELKTYLDTNKHLPEVPSAQEMNAHGVNLKEMNLLLLKKVEELTLYIIEQEKRIARLESEK